MSKINTTLYNSQYAEWKDQWKMIRDFIKGDCAVKKEREKYLPKPCAHDTSDANNIRYNQYIERAYVIGFTGRTAQALLGQAFYKPPAIELDNSVNYLLEDADGDGSSLTQIARQVVSETIDVGRCGLLVDFPQVEGELSAIDVDNGYRPQIKLYLTESIVDWSNRKFGAITRLSSIKLMEKSPALDEFGFDTGDFYDIERILFLDEDGIYRQKETVINGKDVVSEDIITPLDGNGKPLSFIPFQFVGPESNSQDVDKPILLDIAVLNKGQYRNSADDETAAFKVGNPMVVISTDAQPEDLAEGDFIFGSETAVVVPSGDTVSLVQADPNTMSFDRMNKKVEQAQAIGARLITPSKQQTAEAARIDQGSEISVLSTINMNASAALTRSIAYCEIFLNGQRTDKSYIMLSQEFFFSKMSAQERQVWIADVQAGNVPIEDYWAQLRESRIIDESRTNEDLSNDISNRQPDINFDEE